MGAVAVVILHDALAPDAAAQLRHGVGRLGGDADEGRIEGPALVFAELHEIRNVHVHRQPHVRVRRVAEVVKVGLSRRD